MSIFKRIIESFLHLSENQFVQMSKTSYLYHKDFLMSFRVLQLGY